MSPNYIIRGMTRKEMDFAVELARQEGWNPGLNDASGFYQSDPGGFLIGMLDDKPVACISAVSYAGKYGFLGFYIVVPEFRGQGYGLAIWNAALKRLAGHNIGLDGVLAHEANYLKSGFHRAYRNIRFEVQTSGLQTSRNPEIKPLMDVPFEKIAGYDRYCFPVQRDVFLHNWLTLPDSTAVGYFEGDLIRGYGIIRRCYEGYKIGPLFADNGDIADSIFKSLTSRVRKNVPIYLDVPEVNLPDQVLVKQYARKEVFATTRMYTGEDWNLDIKKVFGVTTFELG